MVFIDKILMDNSGWRNVSKLFKTHKGLKQCFLLLLEFKSVRMFAISIFFITYRNFFLTVYICLPTFFANNSLCPSVLRSVDIKKIS